MKFYSIAFFLLELLILSVLGNSNVKILRILPDTEKQLYGIGQMSEKLNYEIDFLVPVYTTGRSGDIVVNSANEGRVTEYLKSIGVQYKEIANEEPAQNRRKRSDNERIELHSVRTEYPTYSQQMKLLEQIRTDNPSFVWTDRIGSTYEKQRMMMITFGYPAPVGYKKPLLFLNCALHAREWIASASCMNIMWKLGYEPEWRDLLKQIDISIIPNANPDGYEFTRSENSVAEKDTDDGTARLWRKNRRGTFRGQKQQYLPNGTIVSVEHECIGVDLNRNFPVGFSYENKEDDIKRDTDGCSITYSGPHPLSEFETRNIYHAIEARKDQMKGFVDVHSYSHLILHSYSYEYNLKDETINDLRRMGNVIREEMGFINNTQYTVMGTTELYPCTGILADSVHFLGVKYSFTIELPPPYSAYNGFVLPANQIANVSDGLFRGIIGLANEIIKEYPTVNNETNTIMETGIKENYNNVINIIKTSPTLLIILSTVAVIIFIYCRRRSHSK